MTEQQRGTLLGVTAYLIWGVGALYWIRTQPVAVTDVVAHRIAWSLPFVSICLLIAGSGRLGRALALLKQPRIVFIMACAALAGATNWLIFLWAVTHGHATEAALGYFLLPLINVVVGLTVFRETLVGAQKIGIAFALAAVILQLVYFGELPLVALGVALSFGLYGAIRKGVAVESMEGLLLETLMLAPFAIAWLVYTNGGGLGQHGLQVDLFLLGAGAYTAIPLITYVAASRMLPLTALGLVFYIGPTTQLLVAVMVFKEPIQSFQMLAFGLVWIGLVIVTLDSRRRAVALKRVSQ